MRRSVYEWTAILLLLSACTVGVVLFGAVRHWSAGALMVLVFGGLALMCARPLLDRHLMEYRLPPGILPLLFVLIYGLLLIPFSSVPYEAKVDFLKLASYVGAYWAWTELALRFHRWRILLFIPLLLGTLVAWYALIMHAQGSTAVLNMVRHENYGMRASGTFMAPAHLGAYMGTMICLAVALIGTSSAGVMLRFFSGYGLLLFLPVLYLSGSRSGWVGALVGVPVILLMRAWRRSLRAFGVAVVVIPLVAAALLAGLWVGSPMFQERVDSALQMTGSAGWRLHAWQDTLVMIGDQPMFGHGPGAYRWTYMTYQTWSGYRWLRYAHNEYLHFLAEYGVVGLVLMGAFLATLLFACVRLFLRATEDRDIGLTAGFTGVLCAALGHAVFDFNLHVFSLVHLLALIGGVAMAGHYRSERLPVRIPPYAAGAAISGVLVLGCVVAAIISFQVAVSNALVRVAEDRVEQQAQATLNPYEVGRPYYERARRIDPGHWTPYLELGNLERSRAFWVRDPEYKAELAQLALEHYHKALARNPYDMNVVYGIGRSWYLLGDEEKSLEYLRRAVAHWPSNVFYSLQLGIQLREMGRYEEALEALRQAHSAGGWDDPQVQSNLRAVQRLLRE